MRPGWLFSDRSDGDFSSSVSPGELEGRCRNLLNLPWTLLDQVHGSDVIHVTRPGMGSGVTCDAAVTDVPGAAIAIRTADCAGVVLVGSSSLGETTSIGVAHAGWKGLLDGVLQNTVEMMRTAGADTVTWHLGPCISAAHYEFGASDLAVLVDRYGEALSARTSSGSLALDLRSGVDAALAEVGAVAGETQAPCTAANGRFYSHRQRSDSGRQVTVAWLESEDGPDFGPGFRYVAT